MPIIYEPLTVHAEISIIPFSPKNDVSMSTEVAAAFDSIRKIQGVKATLTALGTQLEADTMEQVIAAVKAAHEATRREGALRIISSIRIDERLDKEQTLEDKVQSVEKKLNSGH